MISTTGTKKELIDFLWEWAEANGDWSKLLVSKVTSTEQPLTAFDRQLIFDYFLQFAKLKTGLMPLVINKPTFTPTSKKVDLTSLSNVKGVNKLAENQTISFARNLTVIYGENGAGKTGYCRILKALGFSYDPQKVIHSNIHTKSTGQTATIDYRVDGGNYVHHWDSSASATNPDLSTISVFNNNCVQITLGSGRNLIVSPIGFHLFNLVSGELSALTDMLDKGIVKHTTSLPWSINLNIGTPQQFFVANLNAKSSDIALTELSEFSIEQEQELTAKRLELKNLNRDLLDSKIKSYTTQLEELNTIISNIELAKTALSQDVWNQLKVLNKSIADLEKKAKVGINDVAEKKGIAFFNTDEFRKFIQSAEDYIKILNQPNYPNAESDTCVYCKQELRETGSKELLNNYRKLLNDNTQTELVSLKTLKQNITDDIAKLDSANIFHCNTFGLDDNFKIIQPKEITEYNQTLDGIKSIVADDSVLADQQLIISFESYIIFLTDKSKVINKKLAIDKLTLENISLQETKLKNEIAQLEDRKLLNTHLENVKNKIVDLKIVERLEKNRNKFSTNTISRKTTEAREELIKHNFIKIFNDELKHLRKSKHKVDLDFGTSKGSSKVQQKIGTHFNLIDILSEGEQKAIALAEFFTELQLDNSKSPIIFDDPVNSLDHHLIDDVARRLISLSRDRQVIICTHSILLFNSILYFSKQTTFSGLEYKFYNAKTQYDVTGFITDADEEINSVKPLIGLINALLNNTPKDKDEADVASDGYGHLRSAIEICVEHEIFKGTIKRYQKNVALTSFVKVNGELLNTHKDKLNEIFERCCGYFKGHSNPVEIHNEPTVEELKSDFNDFLMIRNAFI